jgi:hypothetical protein
VGEQRFHFPAEARIVATSILQKCGALGRGTL